MNCFAPLQRQARRWLTALRLRYYRRALREIHPLHPDLPAIVLHVQRLEAERNALA